MNMSQPVQPNIVFILIDDMGWRDLGCYGSSFYETPRLDQLAAQGLRFTDAYAACPVCSPTRASILTGRYPARVGITNFIPGNAWGKLMGVPYFDRLPRYEVTIAQQLRDAGYRTLHVGKWHCGSDRKHWPDHFGFDVNRAGCGWGMPQHGYFSPYRIPEFPDGPPGEYLTDRLTDEAITLVREHGPQGSRQGQPFFLHLCHYAVHTPIQVPEHLVAKYQAKARALGLDDSQALVEGEHFACLHKKDERITRRQFQSHAGYAAMMENLDTNIGRLLDAIEQLGMSDNTLVVFTSDNGGLSTAEGAPTCNKPLLEGKGWIYDGGNRVCLLARWPGVIAPGGVSAEPVTSTDYFPTFLQAAGLPLRPDLHCDGLSLLPVFADPQAGLDRDAIYWHYPHYSNQGESPACSIRARDWKLIEHFEDGGRLELFNLANDISESRNLTEVQPHQRDRLYAMLRAWRKSIEARIPDINPEYDAMLKGLSTTTPYTSLQIPGDDRGA